ncbi:MAG: DUF5597 domain-containing protein [Cellulomonadaceae bacterium]|jgi:beta-galactosidase GanA|nr:DUF5597 domain-containing protein [Cellulomonadaceae bacterium]
MPESQTLPSLVTTATGETRLLVDGSPYLIRGGELGNSSGERAYLNDFWPRLDSLNLSTLLVAVYWDAIEPVEGQFDWTTVDELLEDARAHGLRLVLLWFGSWKNSMSSYVPSWVKKDYLRFPRARTSPQMSASGVGESEGTALEILSPFYPANQEADAKAFAALMAHLREVDPQHTVIMVQVENEIGMIPQARDHTPAAEAAWNEPVPAALMAHLSEHRSNIGAALAAQWHAAGGKTAGTWAEVFGDSPATEELFQAWAFAQYVEAVTAAGKSQLNLPMFTNAALIRTGTQPGQYPSAGPLPHLADIWRAGAPSLDFIAPDIYFPNFAQWADAYVTSGNPLFVPEALRSVDAAANALYSFGKHGALGFAPFGIESISGNAATMLAGAYDIVAQLTPLIAQANADRSPQGFSAALSATAPSMTGFLPPTDDQRAPHRIRVGDLFLEATYERVPAPTLADGVINESGQAAGSEKLPAAAIAICVGADEYIIAGTGVTVTFRNTAPGGDTIGILSAEEGRFVGEGSRWQHVRWLNGDQTHQGRHIRLEPGRFAIQKVKLYRYR